MKKLITIRLLLTIIPLLIFASSIFAADPPSLVNYQGILRDSSDKPLNGSYDMIFTFFSASIAGDEILIDQHLASGTGAVTVSDGLFNAWLGGGKIYDGSGPGTYTSLPNLFSDYTDVYLEIEIYNPDTTLWEVLDPRIRIISAAYSLNADNLDGKNSLYFLDTSSTTQTKSGKAIFNASTGNYGVEASGPTAGGYFKDFSQSGYAYPGYGDDGIQAYGNHSGGYFKDADDSGYSYVGYGHSGINAFGNSRGGYFKDADSSGYAYIGYGDYGIDARGNTAGGFFIDSDSSGYAYVGYGDYGIYAEGNTMGGRFKDRNNSGLANVGSGETGISAYGNYRGGYFADTDDSGYAYVGYGDHGIEAFGNSAGGYFKDANSSGYAYVGFGGVGISAHGGVEGAYFTDIDDSGWARVADGDTGIDARGITAGGYFLDIDSGGRAYVGYGDRGIWGKGAFAGATFSHPDNTTYWADVSTSTHKIVGTGGVSFVQNHPYDKSKVITYTAPEGDEVATYTRGSSRLVNGEARIQLGDTFKWVTNPDIGLTSYVTPQGDCLGLYVKSLSTTELVVREMSGGTSNVLFDYMVYGLRIGFEELAVVQEKEREAFLPASEAVQERYFQNPELKDFNAFERFRRMRQAIGETGEIELTRSRALVNAIDENKQEILEKARVQMEMERKQHDRQPEENQELMPEAMEETEQPHPGSPELIERAEKTIAGTIPMDEKGNIHAQSFRSVSPDLTGNVPISEPAEAGDILAIDHVNPGMMRLCDRAADPAVVGIVAGEPGVVLGGSSMSQIEKPQQDEAQAIEGEESSEDVIVEIQQAQAPIALSGIVLCKVDAAYGAIQAGDLLTTSLTKGHAMRSDDHAAGTILGKALEPLDAGTGLIKVLVMMR